MGMEPLRTHLVFLRKGGCDPSGVVEECGADGTRGLRPRAMRWVCSAYLENAAPREGVQRKTSYTSEDTKTLPRTSRMRILMDAVKDDSQR